MNLSVKYIEGCEKIYFCVSCKAIKNFMEKHDLVAILGHKKMLNLSYIQLNYDDYFKIQLGAMKRVLSYFN